MNKLLIILLITVTTANCQDFGKLNIIASFPNHMKEVSGIDILADSNLIWMVEDAGNKPKLYGFDKATESLEKAITLANADNKDWEDLTSNGKSTIYIGDFGNNGNERKDLAIYTVKDVLRVSENETDATKTSFILEDQQKFPPKKKDRNYDIEAFFYLNNYFYLFTRNRSNDFDGTTKLYKLPAQEGNFTAELMDSFIVCDDKKDCEVTSAAIHPESGQIALLTYDKVFLFRNYQNDDFFGGKVREIKLGHLSQKEGITFKDAKTLYIADERNGSNGGNLYELKIKD